MRRFTTVAAVGTMALLGIAATGSTALASGGGTSGGGPGHPGNPARAARCLAAHGADVTRTNGGGYRISIPAGRVGEATTACKRFLPGAPGPIKSAPSGHGSGPMVIHIQPGAKQSHAASASKLKELARCLKDHGAPGVTMGDGKMIVGGTTVIAGTKGTSDGVDQDGDGPATAKAPAQDDPKLHKAMQACASAAPASGVELSTTQD
jgi:hypothetical protein